MKTFRRSLVAVLILLTGCALLYAGTRGDSAASPGKEVPAPSASTAAPALYRVNALSLKCSADVDLSKLLRARVVRVVDGDTVKIEPLGPWPEGFSKAEKVRFLGVDTPETVHPKKKVEYFGKEASAFTKGNLLGKEVLLAFDWEIRDRYDRLLCYLYFPDGTCFNTRLISEGYGYAYTKYPFAFKDEFVRLGSEAREKKKGLWKH